MALGTPVAGTVAYSASAGAATVSPAYPASIVATDALVMFVGQKPNPANSDGVATPSGWTLRDKLVAAGGYGTGFGADGGNTNLYVFTKDVVTADLTGTVAVTTNQNNVTWGCIIRVPSGTGAFSYGTADGQRATNTVTFNVPFSVALTDGSPTTAFASGDVALWAMCISSDVTTPNQFTVPTMAATGATFAAGVELREPDSNIGNDIGGYIAYANCTAGSSSTAPTATVTATGTTVNVAGPIVALRIREVAPPTQNLTPTLYTNTNEFFSTTVSQVVPAQDLTPALYTNTSNFFSITAAALNTLAPIRYDNIGVFYAPSITQIGPDQTLTPALYTNTNVFYTAILSQSGGPQTLSPALLTNTQTFYAPSATATSALAASLFANSQTFYGPAATNINVIVPPMFADSDFIFPPVVTQPDGPQVLTASLFTNTNTFFAANIGATPIQPILGGGSLVRPRKKFRPAILIDLPEEEKQLPDISAKAILAGLSASVTVGSVVAKSPDPIDSRTSLTFTQIETYMLGVRAESSWNDPSDEELLFILDFALD